jgi:hypothetical protein
VRDDQINPFASENLSSTFGLTTSKPISGPAINASLLWAICMQRTTTKSDDDIAESGDRSAWLD